MRLPLLCILLFSSLVCAAQTSDAKPLVAGQVEELYSATLNEKRTLNIYLPYGYKQNDSIRYPVIYLLDGSLDEDFIHVTGLVQFNSFSWVNRVPKSIVVGIANVDRKRDFSFPTKVEADLKEFPTTGHSDKFMAFVEKELQPFIEKNYKTAAPKTLIGQSLGGLFAIEVLLKKPTLFNKYIIISPSLWWDSGSLFHQPSDIFSENFSYKTEVYIGVGDEGLTPGLSGTRMEEDAKVFAEKLKAIKNKSINTYYDYIPNESHATIGHQAVNNAFKMMYQADIKK